MRRLSTLEAASAAWGVVALERVRVRLRREDWRCVRAPAPWLPGDSLTVFVEAALRRRGATCLQRCLVMQAWHAGLGVERDIVVGVAGDEQGGVRSHAWLEGEIVTDFTPIAFRPATVSAGISRPTT